MGVTLQAAKAAPQSIPSGGVANAVSGAEGVSPRAWISKARPLCDAGPSHDIGDLIALGGWLARFGT
jgi:hypothetical protein